jgi:NADPH:quinone reductase-like Zn-dependent oxidoreductase
MKAMLIRRYGGPEVFEAGEVQPPRPGPGEIRRIGLGAFQWRRPA